MNFEWLTLIQLNKLTTQISSFKSIKFLDPDCWYKFTYLLENSAGREPTELDLHCLQKARYIQVQQDSG